MAVLETGMTSTTREIGKKSPKTDKKQVKKVLLVAQELKLARVLAGNNKTARDRALKSLKKWFQNRSSAMPFSEDDFLRIWKGLFYSMWMSDKPLIQEECAENISSLVHALPLDASLLFYKCGVTILMNEWFGIDQLRLDKFLMFVRRLLRQILFVIKNSNWTRDSATKFSNILAETILDVQRQKPIGLLMHFIEIYLEELAKVSEGTLSPHLLLIFLDPFIKQIAFTDDSRIRSHIKKHIFIYLVRQSDLGLEYTEKYKAWRSLGFPGSIDSMQKLKVDEQPENGEEQEPNEVEEKVYDPRAGRVNVDLPQLKFHSKAIVKAILEYKIAKGTNLRSRKCLDVLAENFKKLASGIYPIGIKTIKLSKSESNMSIRKAVNRLVKFDKKIKGTKNNKRKLQTQDDSGDSHEVELRSGKKIKLDNDLHKQVEQKVEDELNFIMKNAEIKKKRKIIDTIQSPPAKQTKQENTRAHVESIFKRNSGTWLVTQTIQDEKEFERETVIVSPKIALQENRPKEGQSRKHKSKESSKNSRNMITDSEQQLTRPKTAWEDAVDKFFSSPKLKTSRSSLSDELIKNSSKNSTPMKRVKINMKLNRSQDVQEHHAQILSSPAIPYDANRKPAKPLLKTPTMPSPINPFYL